MFCFSLKCRAHSSSASDPGRLVASKVRLLRTAPPLFFCRQDRMDRSSMVLQVGDGDGDGDGVVLIRVAGCRCRFLISKVRGECGSHAVDASDG